MNLPTSRGSYCSAGTFVIRLNISEIIAVAHVSRVKDSATCYQSTENSPSAEELADPSKIPPAY